jgi:DNA-binding transcriptional MerR regulator
MYTKQIPQIKDLDISKFLPYGAQSKVARKLNISLSGVNAVVKGRNFNPIVLKELVNIIREEQEKAEQIKKELAELLKRISE